jgi:hypothetical protein
MGRKKLSKSKKAKPKANRAKGKKGRTTSVAAEKNVTESARLFDQVVKEFDGAAEGLQNRLETLRGTLDELVAVGVRRDRLRLMKALADDGILDSLQRLAKALEECGVAGALPESLVPLHRSARMAVDHFCRTFEIHPVHQPGESLTVTNEHAKNFDWSADRSSQLDFPAQVEILRSGWKSGDAVFVLPRVRVRQPAQKDATST